MSETKWDVMQHKFECVKGTDPVRRCSKTGLSGCRVVHRPYHYLQHDAPEGESEGLMYIGAFYLPVPAVAYATLNVCLKILAICLYPVNL